MSTDDKEDDTKNAEDRQKISLLQSEKARKQEVLERLKEKRKALQDELRARQDDLRNLDQERLYEERKQKERLDSRRKDNDADQAVTDYMEVEMRTMLKECIPAFMADSDGDDDEDSDGDQKDRKKDDDGAQKAMHDSVLVSYIAEKATDKDKLDEYYVTYRIDKDTTVELLHKDACEFWGCSQDEYLLCSMPIDKIVANSVENLRNLMNDPHKLVQDPMLLNTRYRAHMYLIQKKVYDERHTRLATWEFNPFDDYGKAAKTTASGVSADTSKTAKGKTQDKPDQDPFATAFAGWPGIYDLVRYKQRPPIRQWAKLKPRDIVIYWVIAILCGVLLILRLPQFVVVRQGIVQSMVHGISGETDPLSALAPDTIVNFRRIRTYDQIWTWLGGSFAFQLFDPRSSFRAYYTPVGFLRIRQQKALQRKNCRREEVPSDIRGTPCYYLEVKPDRYETKPLIIEGDFIDMLKPHSGRAAGRNALLWEDAKDDSVNSPGNVQLSYDGSGYSMDYDLRGQIMDNSYATFLQDLPIFRSKWVDRQTRFLSVEFAAANYNLGGFASCQFVFEMPASGSVNPMVEIKPLRIGDEETVSTVLDILRGVLVMYIALIKVYFETKRKTAEGKSGFFYIFSFLGLVDECTVAVYCAMTYMRLRFEVPKPSEIQKFYSYSYNAYVYEQFFVCEGVFFILIMIRVCSFMRLNPMVLLVWRTIKRASKMYGYFLCIFVPLLLATIMLAHSLFSPYVSFFSTWYETVITIVFFGKQDVNIDLMYAKQRFWTLPFVCCFFLAFTLFFLNGFLAIAVHSYFEVKLSDMGQKEKQWSGDQWADWMLWGPVYRLIFMKDPGSSREDGDDSGDEEDEDDDDDDDKED